MDKPEQTNFVFIKLFGTRIAIEWFVFFLIFGIGPIALLKGFIIKNIHKLQSFYKIKLAGEDLYDKSEVAKITTTLQSDSEDLRILELDPNTERIMVKITKIEVRYLKILVKSSVKFAIANNGKISVKNFSAYILKEYIVYREMLPELLLKAKIEDGIFIRNYMRETYVYYKYITTGLKTLPSKNTLYDCVMCMLEIFFIHMVVYKTTIRRKIHRVLML
jgi:hypothetical protein